MQDDENQAKPDHKRYFDTTCHDEIDNDDNEVFNEKKSCNQRPYQNDRKKEEMGDMSIQIRDSMSIPCPKPIMLIWFDWRS